MDTVSTWMGIATIAFGFFVWSAGIVVFIKLWIEIKWWNNIFSGMLAMDIGDVGPPSISGLIPMFQLMLQGMFQRIIWDLKQATIVISVALFLLGAMINMIGVYMLYW